MLRAGGRAHALGAEQVLDPDGHAFQRPGPRPQAMRSSAARAIVQRPSGVSRMKALSGARRRHGVDMGLGDLRPRRTLSRSPSTAASASVTVRSLCLFDHLGHDEEIALAIGALASTSAGSPPSVTTSSRRGSLTSTAEVIGSTPSVSTSPNCSIQSMMPTVHAPGAQAGPRRANAGEPCDLAHRRRVDGHEPLLDVQTGRGLAAKASRRKLWAITPSRGRRGNFELSDPNTRPGMPAASK